MNIPILFEDDVLLVVNKPAGFVVTNAETVKGETVEEWATQKLKAQMSNVKTAEIRGLPSRGGIVHRLDKETSGCLILAKTPEALVELQRQFKAREVQKEYVALVHGVVEPQEGTIFAPLARSRFDRQKFSVTPGGRVSETSYKVISQLTLHGLRFTLLRLFPKTGRTHQIRVHLQYFGHPIVSDEKYAGEKRAREDRLWCSRIFLHAGKVAFMHPTNMERMTIEAPLPPELTSLL